MCNFINNNNNKQGGKQKAQIIRFLIYTILFRFMDPDVRTYYS